MNDEHLMLLGEMKGKLEAIDGKLDGVDGKLDQAVSRIGHLETRGAVHGALAGGFVAVGMALIIEKAKKTLGL